MNVDIEPEPELRRWHLMTVWLEHAGDAPPPEPLRHYQPRGWKRHEREREATAAENMAVLVQLIARHTRCGEYISTATSHRSPAGVRRLMNDPSFPPGLRHREAVELLLAAEVAGLLERRPFDRRGITREGWVLTPAGRAFVEREEARL